MDIGKFSASAADVGDLLDRQRAALASTKAAKRNNRGQIPRHQRGEAFVKGPVPVEWLKVALSLGGKTANVVWALWWRVGLEQSAKVRLTANVLREFGVSPRTGRELLDRLQGAGLVEVSRKRGRGPDVVVLPVGGDSKQGGAS